MYKSITRAWDEALTLVVRHGQPVAPRGKPTLELPSFTVAYDARRPVLLNKQRQLSYRFMVAEAYWILSGDELVETIAPYNSRIAEFSDDGEKFFGAYGPKIVAQLDYVVEKLMSDPDSRQAGLTIWRENPPATKDVPCTVAIFANIREGKVNLNVFMRSSDLWLGLPYDAFNFSMLCHLVCAKINARVKVASGESAQLEPGSVFITAASSHIYKHNMDDVKDCMAAYRTEPACTVGWDTVTTPVLWFMDEAALMGDLQALRDTRPGDPLRWWEAK